MIETVVNINETVRLLVAGGFGALVKDCLIDNSLELPFIHDKKLYMGSFGAALVGAFIGYAVDGSTLTAMMGGYTGKSVIESLLSRGSIAKADIEKEGEYTGRGLNKADK